MSRYPLTQIVAYYTGAYDTVRVGFHRKRRTRSTRNYRCGMASANRIERIMGTPPPGWLCKLPIVGTQCIGLAIITAKEPA